MAHMIPMIVLGRFDRYIPLSHFVSFILPPPFFVSLYHNFVNISTVSHPDHAWWRGYYQFRRKIHAKRDDIPRLRHKWKNPSRKGGSHKEVYLWDVYLRRSKQRVTPTDFKCLSGIVLFCSTNWNLTVHHFWTNHNGSFRCCRSVLRHQCISLRFYIQRKILVRSTSSLI